MTPDWRDGHGHTAPNALGCCAICGDKVGEPMAPVISAAPPPPAPPTSPPARKGEPEAPPKHGLGPKPMHEHEPMHEPHDVPKGKSGWLGGKGKK